MKILVTGENGFLSKELKKYLSNKNSNLSIDCKSVRDSKIGNIDFSEYNVVIHTAAIVHQQSSDLYFSINRDLTYKIAKNAKEKGVEHFIFISSMSVFGLITGEISSNTPLLPVNDYGRSKLEAENNINTLVNNSFNVSIIRPPMIYGYKSPGNYSKLSKLAKFSPIFIETNNKRSMIYIENLCEFIYQIIKRKIYGVFHPQNDCYLSTSEIFTKIREVNGKKTFLISFNKFIKQEKIALVPILGKVFGDLTYSYDISSSELNYQKISFESSIIKSERG